MKPTQQDLPPFARQLVMALDGGKLWGMTLAERGLAVTALASVLLEAAGAPARESRDDRG